MLLISGTLFSSAPQDKSLCIVCKKPLGKKYLIVDGNRYHPEHFLCAKCGKKIEGSFNKAEGKYYHPACYGEEAGLVCAKCGKNIDGEYIISGDKKYHRECYDNFVLPKCDVCSLPLKGSYTVDSYGNKYHTTHLNETSKCDCCDRLISKTITGGGKALSDGRHICNICYATSVNNQRDIERELDLVAQRLIGMGINLNVNKISVAGVDRNGLKKRSAAYTYKMQGYCDSKTEKEFINNKLVKKTDSHTIYVLNYLPRTGLESVLAHELMHSWIYENTSNAHTDKVREGACNFISYLYLKELHSKESSDFIIRLDKNPDPVYGEGFREIKKRFENRPVRELLSFLK
jgi:hypothetical protein